MNELAAETDAIRRFGDTHATVAAQTLGAGTVDQAAIIAASVPVFGPIGADFLVAFAAAQANHLQSVCELAGVHAASARTAYETAGCYEGADDDSANHFGAIGTA